MRKETIMQMKIVALVAAGICFIGCSNSDRPRVAAPSGDEGYFAKTNDQSQVNAEQLQLFAPITGPMPTGIAVSKTGRVFVNFPRWGDPVEFTVAELKN